MKKNMQTKLVFMSLYVLFALWSTIYADELKTDIEKKTQMADRQAIDLPEKLISKEEKKPFISISVQTASAYLWRGEDYYISRYPQESAKQGFFNFTPALVPTITWHTPIAGLRLDMGYIFALSHREPTNGNLNSVEQYNYAAMYEYSNVGGTMMFGFKIYVYPNSGPINPIDTYGEFTLGYTGPILLRPNWTAHVSLGGPQGSTMHHNLSIEHRFHMGIFSIMPQVKLGYVMTLRDSLLSYPYVDFTLDFNFKLTENMKMYLRPIGVYRPFFGEGQSNLINTGGESYTKPPFLLSLTLGYEVSF